MLLLYHLLIYLFLLAIRIKAVFDPKARAWMKGRRGLFQKLEQAFNNYSGKVVWFHCASLGEFEQGRPVIETLRKEFPDVKILLTFFSSSGFEIRKNYPLVDHVFYLPADTPQNAREFVRIVKPQVAIFVKYEFWFNYIHTLHQQQIPLIIISAVFRPDQWFFKPGFKWSLRQLKKVTHFFVQDDASAELLNNAGITQVTISGDTRFDRVYSIIGDLNPFPLVEVFSAGSKVLVAGSTWPEDERLLARLTSQCKNLKYVIAPHEVDQNRIQSLQKQLPVDSVRYSLADAESLKRSQVLIIDTIGILSQLYQYATIAYVGGGFGNGIHNILEPAAFGIPVIFGPHHKKFREAVDLINLRGAFPVRTPDELINTINQLLGSEKLYAKAAETTRNYVTNHRGATRTIFDYLRQTLSQRAIEK